MKRRTLLAGLGASAAGSAILFGSGAFTQVEAERDLTIGVDEDSNALLALEAGEVASVFSDSGELVIDTDELSSGNEGFNVNSSVLIGETEQDIVNRNPGEAEVVADLGSTAGGTGAAFRLTNNFDNTADNGNRIDVGINLEDVDAGDNNITFIISQYESGDGRNNTPDDSFTVSDGSQVVINNLEDGDQLYFAIEIETGSDDISGNITFRAGPNLKDGFPTSPVQAVNPVVNVTQDTTFSSISGAIDNADRGDLIQADSSKTYNEQITVNVKNLTVEGVDGATVTAPGGKRDTITASASGVTIRGLTVEATGGSTPRAIVLNADNTAAVSNNVSHADSVPDKSRTGPLIAVAGGDNVTVDGNTTTDGPIAYTGGNNNQVAFTNNAVEGDLVDEGFFAFSGTDPDITFTGNDFSAAKTGQDADVKFDLSATVNGETDDAAIAGSVVNNNTDVDTVELPDNTFADGNTLFVPSGNDIQPVINTAGDLNGVDTVRLAEDKFTEDVIVDVEGLTLEGAGASSTKPTIRGNGNDGDDISIKAPNVTIEGLELRPSTVTDGQSPNNRSVVFIDSVNSDVDGFEFRNNKVEIDESNVDDEYNNLVTTQFGSTVSDHVYEGNEFVATATGNLVRQLVVNGDGSAPSENITVRDNTFTGDVDGGAILSVDASNSLIERNSFEANTNQTQFALVGVGGATRDSPAATNVTVQSNTFTDTPGSGVRYFQDNTGNLDLQTDIIDQNTFEPSVSIVSNRIDID